MKKHPVPPEAWSSVRMNKDRRHLIIVDARDRLEFPELEAARLNAHQAVVAAITAAMGRQITDIDWAVLEAYDCTADCRRVLFVDPKEPKDKWGTPRYYWNFTDLRAALASRWPGDADTGNNQLRTPTSWTKSGDCLLPADLAAEVWPIFAQWREADLRARDAHRKAVYDLRAAMSKARTLAAAVEIWPRAAQLFDRYQVGVAVADSETLDRIATLRLKGS